MGSHARKNLGLKGTGIIRVGDLFVPFTEVTERLGPRGGKRSLIRYWGFGFPTWVGAKHALGDGRESTLANPAVDAVPVDTRSGKPLARAGGDRGAVK
jgi:hypothetical protein